MIRIERLWYRSSLHPLLWPLLPLSWLFRILVAIRRCYYRFRPSAPLPLPVIIVGNISVGGSGKTPLVAQLVQKLTQSGWRVGIVSRGYGGKGGEAIQRVSADSDPALVGDEPRLLAELCAVPLVVGRDRRQAALYLWRHFEVDLVISDDGLQHYRLPRDMELVVVDGERRFGNGHLLPVGPLREPPARLKEADMVICHRGAAAAGEWPMVSGLADVVNLVSGETRTLAAFRRRRVHAVAAIGYPQRFFVALEEAGLIVESHPFADHHPFIEDDLAFNDSLPVLMTAKDGVKCRSFASDNWWVVALESALPEPFWEALKQQLARVRR
ncbi:tetraacyldisaccharide 4'-kinase [Ectothiorhodospiraceae bacterium BW-2]|nr:tetraacyldisaccharide 4'-kinase [Ectothiorhodospiraceae bacterium BW-2]